MGLFNFLKYLVMNNLFNSPLNDCQAASKAQDALCELQSQVKTLNRLLNNARWVAIFEFLTLFNETEGKIADSSYMQSAWKLMGIPLTEKNIIEMADYAAMHLKADAEYTEIMKRM